MIYSLNVNFIVETREGSGMVLTVDDIANALRKSGSDVEFIKPITGESPGLKVKPPRHVVTGKDLRLEAEENKEAK